MAEYKQVDLQIGTETQFESKKETLPIGTFVGITDPIHKSELDSDLQTSINSIANKLDKPSSNPTEDSVVKVSSTGSVEYVPYKKYYKHIINISTSTSVYMIIYAILSHNIEINTAKLLESNYNSLAGSPMKIEEFETSLNYNAIFVGSGAADGGYIDILSHKGLNTYSLTDAVMSDSATEL